MRLSKRLKDRPDIVLEKFGDFKKSSVFLLNKTRKYMIDDREVSPYVIEDVLMKETENYLVEKYKKINGVLIIELEVVRDNN